MTLQTDRLKAALAERYRNERALGQGGMATVMTARTGRVLRLLAFVILAGPASVAAQNNDAPSVARTIDSVDAARAVPMRIHRLTSKIEFDGVVNEAAWDAVQPIPMFMFSPGFLAPLTERTDVRIAHDDRYLYVAGRLYDSDVTQIRTNTFYRDAYSGDDLLAVIVDSYNDYETAVWFVTNPAGTRNDRAVSNDAVFSGGVEAMNTDWNSHWEVATSKNEQGWYAEFRIPFSTLGFQARSDEVAMGVIVYRFIARKNERQIFPAIDPKWGGLAFAKPSQAQRVVLSQVRQSKPVYITPYILGGGRQTAQLNEPGSSPAFWTTSAQQWGDVGGDVRYSPTSNLALDLTVNTDFAQVEADDQQINLTRLPLFFPEKRQFFQERASTFQFTTGGSSDRLFHSRRVGLADGEIVPLYGGVRVVGRVGGMDYGLLSMQTQAHGERSSENMSVARLNQQILNKYSSIGAMVTARYGSSGDDNLAYGVDAVLRPLGDEWLTLRWAQTFDEVIDERSAASAGLLQARWERVRDDGFTYSGEFNSVGEDYIPRLGYQSRTGVRHFGGHAQYKRFQGASSPLRSTGVQANSGHFIRTLDGTADSRWLEGQLNIELKNGRILQLAGRSNFEGVLEDFDVAGAVVPAGEYWFHDARVSLELARSANLRGNYFATAGSFYDGTRVGVAFTPSWNPSRYIELGGGYELNRLTFNERDEDVTAHLARVKVQLALNTHIFFSTFAQYSNVADLATFNARFRYHFREGTDLWLVFNEGLNMERDVVGRPRLPRSSGRTFMLKYTHTFIW